MSRPSFTPHDALILLIQFTHRPALGKLAEHIREVNTAHYHLIAEAWRQRLSNEGMTDEQFGLLPFLEAKQAAAEMARAGAEMLQCVAGR